jgi:hypothetical protein
MLVTNIESAIVQLQQKRRTSAMVCDESLDRLNEFSSVTPLFQIETGGSDANRFLAQIDLS